MLAKPRVLQEAGEHRATQQSIESDSDDDSLNIATQTSASVHGFADSPCHVWPLLPRFCQHILQMLPKREDSLSSLSSRT